MHHESGSGKAALPIPRRLINRPQDRGRKSPDSRGTAATLEGVPSRHKPSQATCRRREGRWRWRCVRCCRAAGAATFWNSRARHAADAGAGIAQGRRRLVIGTTGIRQSKAETCIWLDPLPGSSIREGRLTLRLCSCVPVGSTYIIFKKASKKASQTASQTERKKEKVYREGPYVRFR